MEDQLNSLAGRLSQITNSMRALGIDSGPLYIAAGAVQLIGGTAQGIKGLIAAKQALTAYRMAEGTAHLLKYGPAALTVAGLATAGGYAMGQMIEKAINTTDGGGLRRISEAYA